MKAQTLDDAREAFRLSSAKGGNCPLCQTYGKTYRRKFNKGLWLTLRWLVLKSRAKGGDWVNIPETGPAYVLKSREQEKLAWRYWLLAERLPNTTDPSRRSNSGFWRPTSRGFDFFDGKIKIPSHVWEFHSRPYKCSDVLISFREATPFSLPELLNEVI